MRERGWLRNILPSTPPRFMLLCVACSCAVEFRNVNGMPLHCLFICKSGNAQWHAQTCCTNLACRSLSGLLECSALPTPPLSLPLFLLSAPPFPPLLPSPLFLLPHPPLPFDCRLPPLRSAPADRRGGSGGHRLPARVQLPPHRAPRHQAGEHPRHQGPPGGAEGEEERGSGSAGGTGRVKGLEG